MKWGHKSRAVCGNVLFRAKVRLVCGSGAVAGRFAMVRPWVWRSETVGGSSVVGVVCA